MGWSFSRVPLKLFEPTGFEFSMLAPTQLPGVFVYCSLGPGQNVSAVDIVSSIQEPKGLSVIVRESVALENGWPILFRAAWIRFGATTDLSSLGLTAAVSTALAAAGISCNMVAGAYHDHVFVPLDRARDALALLQQIKF
jgi:uncharacterized protein